MSKQGLISYKQAYAKCEEALKEKKEASSQQLVNWLLENYKMHQLNVTPKGLSHYLKLKGYSNYKKYESKPYIWLWTTEEERAINLSKTQ